MVKLLVVVGAFVWGAWWFAGAFHGPMQKDAVTYSMTAQGELQKSTTYDASTQKAYRHAVQTPVTANDWLGRLRRNKSSWQWWAVGCAPLALALFVVVRGL